MAMARFVALHPRADAARTPRFAVLIARTPKGVTLVYSNGRKVWELPGGLIDPGESALECAAREFREETGGEPGELSWLGLVEIDDGGTHYGAVIGCTARHVPDQFENWETGGLAFWTRDQAPEPMGHTDAALLERLG